MTNISHDLSGKIDKKTVAILSEIDTAARDLSLSFFIVGATARDILLQHVYDIHVMRATVDIDRLKKEAGSSQGHKIAMDVLRADPFQKEPYDQIVANINAILRGIFEVGP